MKRKRLLGVITVALTILGLAISLHIIAYWQIEMIWIAYQFRGPYCLPFNSHKSLDWWYWHDWWFIAGTFALAFTGISCFWLGWRTKELWDQLGGIQHE